jgi:mannose-6-phosphate isomerase
MGLDQLGLLRFEEGYFERIWGGQKLRTDFGKDAPAGKPIGEAWLVSDHEELESVVAEGPYAGRSLRDLLQEDAGAVLGADASLTIHGRFPLLLKILDAADFLSVQVHPDDDAAKEMGEPDVGKTEMWHVLQAESDSELICGMDRAVTPETFAQGIGDGSFEKYMTRFPVDSGTSVFVPSGTVHAIGAGIVLAEIQQNSNLTYRIYDWGRVQADGKPRALHVDKALKAIQFGSPHGGPAKPLGYVLNECAVTVLAACRYFSAELVAVETSFKRITDGRSFHILLARDGEISIDAGGEGMTLRRGQAVLVPGRLPSYQVTGAGCFLDYYVPDLTKDVVEPLRAAGHHSEAIVALGGPAGQSDLAPHI